MISAVTSFASDQFCGTCHFSLGEIPSTNSSDIVVNRKTW